MIFSCTIDEKDKLTKHISSTHFDYYYSASDSTIIDTNWQEEYYKWLIQTIEVTPPSKFIFNKYRDRDHMERMTGKVTNGFAEIGTNKIHTILKVDNHEIVHTLITKSIGHPPALFNEGIAVAHQASYSKYPEFIPGWNSKDYNLLAKNYKKDGKIPPLDELLGVSTFWQYKTNTTYPISGSFVRFLIDNYNLDKIKEFIKISTFEDPKEKIRANFLAIYEFSIETAWSRWNVFIDKYDKK